MRFRTDGEYVFALFSYDHRLHANDYNATPVHLQSEPSIDIAYAPTHNPSVRSKRTGTFWFFVKSALPRRFRDIPSSLLARTISSCLLICISVSLVGLPLIPPVAEKSAEAFPCMNSPCGCSTAAQCWDKCCCHTDTEKLAWAKRHGVEPPVFLTERVSLAQKIAKSKPSLCCCSKDAKSCQVTQKTKPVAPNSLETPDQAKPNQQSTARLALWQSVQKCRGVDVVLNLLGCCWTPLGESLELDRYPLIIGNATPSSDSIVSLSLPIDPPVPRSILKA